VGDGIDKLFELFWSQTLFASKAIACVTIAEPEVVKDQN
jgi:hypothetical protein